MAFWPRRSLSLALIGAEVIVLFIYFLLLPPSSVLLPAPLPFPPPPPPASLRGRPRVAPAAAWRGCARRAEAADGPVGARRLGARGGLPGHPGAWAARGARGRRGFGPWWGYESHWTRGEDAPGPPDCAARSLRAAAREAGRTLLSARPSSAASGRRDPAAPSAPQASWLGRRPSSPLRPASSPALSAACPNPWGMLRRAQPPFSHGRCELAFFLMVV